MLDFADEHALRQMLALEVALGDVLVKANAQRVEAAVAVFALMRHARRLLYLYPVNAQRMLLNDIILPFLHGEAPEKSNLLVM